MKNILLFLAVLIVISATVLWVRHGGGNPYPDLTDTPLINNDALEVVLTYPEPVGNVAVNEAGRIFFTVHPEARPSGNKLLEYVNGASVPFPSLRQQKELFDTPLGMVIDRYDRLWVIDHGNHGLRRPRIVAIDLPTGEVLRSQDLSPRLAPAGSLLQDLAVSNDAETIVISDSSFWRKQPALIVYDVQTGNARRVLKGHESVRAENYRINAHGRDMKFFGGMVSLRRGVDGVAFGPDWLYFGAMNGSGLYRVRLADLRNENLPAAQLEQRVKRFSDKPLSDGFSFDNDGNVYVTDVEHGAVFRVDRNADLRTVIQSKRIRWPDALSFGPDGYLYLADSALPELVLQSPQHIKEQGPYRIYRFKPGTTGAPGQ